MKKAIFVSGTGTGVGKTVFSAILASKLLHQGFKVGYYKPVESGQIKNNCGDIISSDCQFVSDFCCHSPRLITKFCYGFTLPASPHLAARKEKPCQHVKMTAIENTYHQLIESCDYLICEGAGGLYVPLNDQLDLIADIPVRLGLRVLLVAPASLGAINHVALSYQFLVSRAQPIAAIVLIYYGCQATEIEKDNREVLIRITGLDSIFLIPAIANLSVNTTKVGQDDPSPEQRPSDLSQFSSLPILSWFGN